ncbi:MAG TPA: hypothetical protein VLX30_11470 [Burkholderiales bacterium]|nr:hypothetical protein [Burkholderiales bacterium]
MAVQARRRNQAALIAAGLLLAACAGGPPAPDWQANAHASLDSFEAAYLRGDDRVAKLEFARARAEASRTGRPELLARIELARCALEVASLEFDDCPGYRALEPDASAAERAYATYLSGRWQELDPALLAAAHRAAVTGGSTALAAIDDPLARLVAAGALLRAGRIEPQGIGAAIDAASANGWRRPLLAWLELQAGRAAAAGDHDAEARIRRRIHVIVNP